MGEAKRSAGCTPRAFLAAWGRGDGVRVQGHGTATLRRWLSSQGSHCC
jgi:hypothetical protein